MSLDDRKRVPWSLSFYTPISILLTIGPAIGINRMLAAAPHTSRGCEVDSGPFCGDSNGDLGVFTSLLIALFLAYLILALVSFFYNGYYQVPVRYWPAFAWLFGVNFVIIAPEVIRLFTRGVL